MFTQSFTVCLSSLNLLNAREKGVISHFKTSDENLLQKILEMGINPGLAITLEQRFPNLVIQIGENRLVVNEKIAQLIYVRVGTSKIEIE
ncbi:FeoA family protein [Oscillatoria salina]|uniref:FeoA family protein n=1 Tax=Oscillatoria salina TaxID=331517 RepID=UPI0013BD7523|nr:FeoA family protein [Oscillatoria salina]MBZ8181673.1 ferrous iron transport protein A [Oscillatoria salina IIICB1]NET90676.1 ferrous iron transport protein A [Kamptonema sp. SIO1D9]